jgi:hypothetical protein
MSLHFQQMLLVTLRAQSLGSVVELTWLWQVIPIVRIAGKKTDLYA